MKRKKKIECIRSSAMERTKKNECIHSSTMKRTKKNECIRSSTLKRTKKNEGIRSSTIDVLPLLAVTVASCPYYRYGPAKKWVGGSKRLKVMK
jgi:hypothetical protein